MMKKKAAGGQGVAGVAGRDGSIASRRGAGRTMSIAHEFEYERAATLAEALGWLAKPGTMALAGGTDLIAWLRDGAVTPKRVVDVKGIPELQGIAKERGGRWLRVGAAVPLAEVVESELVREVAPELAEAASMMASVGVRNRGTVAGNICSAVPCCDCGPALLVLGAEVVVAGKGGERRVGIDDWFLGPRKTALKLGELVTGIRIPIRAHWGAFAKLKRYRGEDLAQASAAVSVSEKGEWRVALGSVGPVPMRSPAAEKALSGKDAGKLSAADFEQAGEAAAQEARPITDIRSSETYRRLMTAVLVKRAAAQAVARRAGKGVELGVNVMEED